eukprot:gnl/TRDRNA2_/TRDRNA2_90496_c0_seq1.p1 gnl/TRDRNA2_/TRDRNA2_90496_c0~~gnl/TRDRNA2_/TRDRNA2_90496_c0_seq1.p1  ORF type:complete len:153 (-),score=16.00 gnl/TRDRNA2_/TRDRNA2_90496_c0_seq1:282-740(-)
MAPKDPFAGYSFDRRHESSNQLTRSASPSAGQLVEILSLEQNPEILESLQPFQLQVAVGNSIQEVRVDPLHGPIQIEHDNTLRYATCYQGHREGKQKLSWSDMTTMYKKALVIATAKRNASICDNIVGLHGQDVFEMKLRASEQEGIKPACS